MTPKLIPKDVTLSLPGVRLYLDDLSRLITRLTVGGESVELKSGDQSFKDVDELSSHGGVFLTHLEISVSAPQGILQTLWLRIQPDRVWIFGHHAFADRAAGAAELLRSFSPWYSWQPGNRAWWHGLHFLAVIAAIWLGVALVPDLFPQRLHAVGLATALLGGVGLTVFALSDRVWAGGSRIYLKSRASHRSFWERNRDAILVSAITSVMTGIVGFLIGRATAR